MNKISRKLPALFVIGVAALYPPLMGAFNRPASVLGIPLLPLYLFTVWGTLVAGAWILNRRDKP